MSHFWFNAILFALAGFQFLNILLLLHMASQLHWSTTAGVITSLFNLFAVKVIIGTSSSFSGIVVAHELIHRSQPTVRILGRLLLCLECYEHFATEHIRGHHQNVGTDADPATARFGESFEAFWKRTVPAQFKHAWRLESNRLGINKAQFVHRRLLNHQVFQGLLFEFALVVGIASFFGLTALLAFALQALAAVRKLEAVNYIEHWGLKRGANGKHTMLSWDTDSWFTLNTLVGLSRHTDHHQYAARPFSELCYHAESPKLPYGYFAMVFITVLNNRYFRSLATKELNVQGLSPISSPLGDYTKTD